MRGYSENRVNTHGREDLQRLDLGYYSNELRVEARESSKKQRGVDIRIFLDHDDIVRAIRLACEDNRLLRLRLQAEISRLEYEAAVSDQASDEG